MTDAAEQPGIDAEIRKSNHFEKLSNELTADRTMWLVTSIATPIATWTHDCWASAPSIAALERTVAVATCCSKARGSLEGVDDLNLGSAEMWRLVTSIATRNDCVAEFVLRQAFARSAWEGIGRTPSWLSEVAFLFVFAIGTLSFTIAQRRLRNAFSTPMALEWLLWTLRGRIGVFLQRERTFLIGSILKLMMDCKDTSWLRWMISLHCSPSCHHTQRTSWCRCHLIDTEIEWKILLLSIENWGSQTWKVPSAHPVFLAEHSDDKVECLADSHSQVLWSLQNVCGSANWHCLSL